jgi:caspase domain-containing protein
MTTPVRRTVAPTLAVMALLAAGAASAEPPRSREAVIVGANGAPAGRKPLVYGRSDARKMAEVLATVGGFRGDQITVLEDPTPARLLAAVEGATRRLADQPHAVLYFYYSGHADDRCLYPSGQALPMAALRRLIDEARVATKIGVVDACRGGGWTRAKGLAPAEPFAVQWPMTNEGEGSVMIASSSGQESAHESDQLRASFFTFHFVAGLRGAADSNANNEVTLTEAYEYAKERTIRDTLRLARETQHPSYEVNLRGRRDLVLTRVEAGPTTVQVVERQGPLQIIDLESGVELLEVPPGRRHIRLAVPPGRYLVRKTTPEGNLVKELAVHAGGENSVDEDQLTLFGNSRLAIKSGSPERPPQRWRRPLEWSLAGGAVAALAVGFIARLISTRNYYEFNMTTAPGGVPSGGQGSPPVSTACNRGLPDAGGAECQSLLTSGDRAALVSNMAFISVPVLAGTALIVYLTAPASEAQTAQAPTRLACAPALGPGFACAATF